MSFEKLLKELDENSKTKKEKGTLFEELIKQIFVKAKPYSERYEEVWLWNEFPYAKKQDIGIDLVAKIKGENEYAAIQCKFYSQDNYIQKSDVDTFISASNIPLCINPINLFILTNNTATTPVISGSTATRVIFSVPRMYAYNIRNERYIIINDANVMIIAK